MLPSARSAFYCISFCWLGSAFCAAPVVQNASWQSAERAKLLTGVSSIPKLGVPGPIALWGPTAFPIVAGGEEGKPECALAAAAGFGKGRIILFGHSGYVSPENGVENGLGVLLVNSVKWISARPNPRVGVYSSNATPFLESKGFAVKKITGALDRKTLSQFDVLVLNAQAANSETDGAAILDFVQNGGGIIAGMTGWAFSQTSGGKRLNREHGLNQAFAAAGISFTDVTGFDKKPVDFSSRKDLPPLMNAQAALDAIQQHPKGDREISSEEFQLAGSAIQIALAAQPVGRSAFPKAVLAALSGGAVVPTEKSPLTLATAAFERSRLGVETQVLKITDAADIQAHPAAKIFPGVAPTDAQRVNREITINPDTSGWTSTGLWANAGDKLSVKLPAALAGKGYAFRIGCHKDTLYHLDKWQRAPEITRSFPLEDEVTPASSAFGGLLYIDVPERAKGTAPFNVTISAAIEAPLFVLGRDDDAKWNSTLKNHKAPWAEFACDKVILICPTENARRVTNPTELMLFWQKVVEAQDEISNQSKERRRPERIVCDVQISNGYMHSGYPIMVPVSAADEMITYGGGKAPGWGFYHELGHNHQRADFTFEGTGEVTNNVLGLYVYHQVLRRDPLTGHGAVAPEKLQEHINLIRRLGDKFSVWKKDPFVALTTYIQLIDGFGWDAWRRYLHSFGDPAFGPGPKEDEQKRDQFLVRYSKITGKDLGPFFEFWGIPVSAEAKAEVAKLESWMPAPHIPKL